MRKNFTFVVIVFLLMVLVSGCGGNDQKSIVGLWEEENGEFSWEFFDDGTCVLNGITAEYSIVEDGKLKVTVMADSTVFGYSIKGDTLTATNQGQSFILIKASN